MRIKKERYGRVRREVAVFAFSKVRGERLATEDEERDHRLLLGCGASPTSYLVHNRVKNGVVVAFLRIDTQYIVELSIRRIENFLSAFQLDPSVVGKRFHTSFPWK